MKKIRIIPRLEVKSDWVVKGIRMEGLRVVGAPADMARAYYQEGADEIIFEDIVASLYGRLYESQLVSDVSEQMFIPLCVAGGVRTVGDFQILLRRGADKVALNTEAVNDPDLIRAAARVFGSQCVVSLIQAKVQPGGFWEPYTLSGRERSYLDVIDWAQRAEDLGAGEILLLSVDNDGTMREPPIGLVKAVTAAVKIPVIAGGGVGSVDGIERLVCEGGASGISISHVLHFKKITIGDIKSQLIGRGIDIRNSVNHGR